MSSSQDWLGLQGQVCVVTGAASGIGASIAERLTQVGARVVLPVELLRPTGLVCGR